MNFDTLRHRLSDALAETTDRHTASTSTPNLYAPIRYALDGQGKRVRGVLCLMGCHLFGGEIDRALPAAVAVEWFHNFTLVHDDVMDNASTRRGRPSVYWQHGRDSAILSGDVMLVQCYQILGPLLAEHPLLLDIFNRTAVEVCEGQQHDMDFEQRSDVTIEQYLEMIRLKTSVLLRAALEMGAVVAEADEAARKALGKFGLNIGLAFQVMDDYLDSFGDDQFGKRIGGDILQNKKTYLYLKARELADEQQQAEFEQLLQLPTATEDERSEKIARTLKLYDKLGIRGKCRNKMDEYQAKAFDALARIDAPAERKRDLRDLADRLLDRVV